MSKNEWFQECFEIDNDLLYILDFSSSDDLIKCIQVSNNLSDAYSADENILVFSFPKGDRLAESQVARIYKTSVGIPKLPDEWNCDWFVDSRIVNPELLDMKN
jgi:hypothetical protein